MLKIMECVLFAAGDSVPMEQFCDLFDVSMDELEPMVAEETKRREEAGNALLIRRFENRVQLATNAKYMDYIVRVLGAPTSEDLSKAMMETLAIIAYKQPVTRVEIEQLRGVNSSYIISTLLEKGLISEAGRKETIGRPILYTTSEKFLRNFGMESILDLPPVEEAE